MCYVSHFMPLYIDLHIDNKLTPELIQQCHIADKAIQDKYGVRYLQVLLNQPQGYLFCLVEGPDKEACARVHAEAHGSIACNILEITSSDVGALLAGKNKDSFDFTLNPDGTVDSGNRAILMISILGSVRACTAARQIIQTELNGHKARIADSFGNAMASIFSTATAAVDAATSIQKKLAAGNIAVEARIGVNFGSPMEAEGTLFEDVCRVAQRLAFISPARQVAVSSKVSQLYHGADDVLTQEVKVVSAADEEFLERLMDAAEKVWDDSEVNIVDFATTIGMSKSQLTRKLHSLAGMSPNEFLNEYRLRRAMELMLDGKMNIAEVSVTIGFNNPSYFTKCFRERFGMPPSEFRD
jgi:AraC-like DNA-binding protein